MCAGKTKQMANISTVLSCVLGLDFQSKNEFIRGGCHLSSAAMMDFWESGIMSVIKTRMMIPQCEVWHSHSTMVIGKAGEKTMVLPLIEAVEARFIRATDRNIVYSSGTCFSTEYFRVSATKG